MTDHRFQVDLRGIIDLLANHLYSSPRVFVRELLQNAVDAIRARRMLEPQHRGVIEVEVTPGSSTAAPTLTFVDDGIGLDEDEVHQFLATIGLSSKRDGLGELRGSFIGQFGIGLLSCFMVAEEIVVVTRSARPGSPTLEWKGRDDGTYTLRRLDGDLAPGTRVYLRARAETAELLEREPVEDLIRYYGEYLGLPVRLRLPAGDRRLDRGAFPWQEEYSNPTERDEALRHLCRETHGFEPMECITLRSGVGEVAGVAYVVPEEVSVTATNAHRVYHKGMLLSEACGNLLPPWAVFVKCVVNAESLRPTASREAFFEDADLDQTRRALGRSVKRHLLELAEHAPERLRRLVAVHLRSMKSLAVADDEFFRIAIAYLPFETSAGPKTIPEYRRDHDDILYAPTVEEFHQLSTVAAARGLCVINAGRTYSSDLLRKFATLEPDVSVRALKLGEMLGEFQEPVGTEREPAARLIKRGDAVLARYRCRVEVRRFEPSRLPVLLVLDRGGDLYRAIEISKEASDALWSSVLDSVKSGLTSPPAILCLNLANPLVSRLTGEHSDQILDLALQMLYIQGLLLGQHPLRSAEIELLSGGLLEIIELAVDTGERGAR